MGLCFSHEKYLFKSFESNSAEEDFNNRLEQYDVEVDLYRSSLKVENSISYIIDEKAESFKIPNFIGKIINLHDTDIVVATSMKINNNDPKIYRFCVKIRQLIVLDHNSEHICQKYKNIKDHLDILVKDKMVMVTNSEYINTGTIISDISLYEQISNYDVPQTSIMNNKDTNENNFEEKVSSIKKKNSSADGLFNKLNNDILNLAIKHDKDIEKGKWEEIEDNGSPKISRNVIKRIRKGMERRYTY